MFVYHWPKTVLKVCQCHNKISKLSPLWSLHQQRIVNLHSTPMLQVEGKLLKMPSLSPTMVEGTIVKWLKAEGDELQAGDVICDIQTDKTVISLEVDDDGILAKILVKEDVKDIKIGTTIALMVDEGEDWKSVEMPTDEEVSKETVVVEKSSTPSPNGSSSQNYGPAVRLLLEKYNLSSSNLTPSGPHSKLLKGDVLKVVKDKNLTPVQSKKVTSVEITPKKAEVTKAVEKEPIQEVNIQRAAIDAPYVDLELTNIRKIIAKRLTESKQQIAHTYSTAEFYLDPLLKLRKQMKADGFSVSLNDLLIKCVAASLKSHPEINCSWKGSELVAHSEVDISVAVATPSGLITPIVHRADSLGVEEIAIVVRDLATRAKSNKLKPHEFQGGTFTISNLGMFGIKEFTAIINPPQCAILAVGGGQLALNGEGLPVTKMRATLSYDQMAISDDSAADFLQSLQGIIENPLTVLLGAKKSAKSLLGLL